MSTCKDQEGEGLKAGALGVARASRGRSPPTQYRGGPEIWGATLFPRVLGNFVTQAPGKLQSWWEEALRRTLSVHPGNHSPAQAWAL